MRPLTLRDTAVAEPGFALGRWGLVLKTPGAAERTRLRRPAELRTALARFRGALRRSGLAALTVDDIAEHPNAALQAWLDGGGIIESPRV